MKSKSYLLPYFLFNAITLLIPVSLGVGKLLGQRIRTDGTVFGAVDTFGSTRAGSINLTSRGSSRQSSSPT
jgi:hypothetical protein